MAKKRLEKGTYGAWNNGMDLTIALSFTPNFSPLGFIRRGIRLWLTAELRTIFSRSKTASIMEPMLGTQEAKLAM
jgi:hypothetical protein